MNITNVNIKLIKAEENDRLRAIAAITIDDCFVVHDLKILKNGDSLFVAMPSKKLPSGEYKDVVHPIDNTTRKMLQDTVLEHYAKVLIQAQATDI